MSEAFKVSAAFASRPNAVFKPLAAAIAKVTVALPPNVVLK